MTTLPPEGPASHCRNALQVLELAQPGRKGQGRVLTEGEVQSITQRLWKAVSALESNDE